MKKTFAIAILVMMMVSVVFAVDTNKPADANKSNILNDYNDINFLRARIKQLEKTIEAKKRLITSMRQELDEQIKENQRLKKILSQTDIDISPQKEPLTGKSENVINVSLEQLCQLVKGPLTDLQKKEQYKNYAGKRVQWTGRIVSISNLINTEIPHFEVQFIYDMDNYADIRVEIQESQKQKLLSLNTGDRVSYQGKLPDSYEEVAFLYNGNLSLTNGKIIY